MSRFCDKSFGIDLSTLHDRMSSDICKIMKIAPGAQIFITTHASKSNVFHSIHQKASSGYRSISADAIGWCQQTRVHRDTAVHSHANHATTFQFGVPHQNQIIQCQRIIKMITALTMLSVADGSPSTYRVLHEHTPWQFIFRHLSKYSAMRADS